MRAIRGCEWWKFRAGKEMAGGWWVQFGLVTLCWVHWRVAGRSFEVHLLNWCLLRTFSGMKEKRNAAV